MKTIKYFLFALAGLSLFACSKDDSIQGQEDSKPVSISVSLGGLGTRATAPSDIFTSDTLNVNSVLINLTNASGVVIVSKTITKDAALDSDWDKLTNPAKGLKFINIPESIAKVYAYGNPGSAVTNNVINTTLASQQGSGVLYYGVDEDLTPVDNEPVNPDPTTGKTYNAQVTLTPIIARLQITKVSFLTDGSTPFSREINNVLETATVSWTGFSADLKGIYFNNFYNTYNNPGTFSDLLSNNTFQGNIQLGQWLFTNPSLNAAEFASYSNYTGGAYQNLPLETANKCYAFNFFPGTAMPMIHLDLANLQITDIQSTDDAVFNPSLFPSERFANIVKFYKNVNTPMTAADFVAGKLYNMEIVVMPILDNDLGNIQYNILVKVTIAPWSEETIIPGFDLEQ